MPLYRVQAEMEIILFAENQEEAEREVDDAVREAIREEPENLRAWEPRLITELRNIDPEWRTSRPYNRDDDDTCQQIFEAEKEARPPSAKELEAAGQMRLTESP